MATEIDEWWPQLNRGIRSWVQDNLFSPLAPYTLAEIERLGGPGSDHEYWSREEDGALSLPPEALQWIIGHPDREQLDFPREPDSRAAYFRRSWPQSPR